MQPSPRLTDVAYDVALSSDLEEWSDSAVLVSSEAEAGVVTRTYRDTEPIDGVGQRFMRLKVTRP